MGQTQYGIHGGTDFMTHVRQKFAFGLVGRFGGLFRGRESLVGHFELLLLSQKQGAEEIHQPAHEHRRHQCGQQVIPGDLPQQEQVHRDDDAFHQNHGDQDGEEPDRYESSGAVQEYFHGLLIFKVFAIVCRQSFPGHP